MRKVRRTANGSSTVRQRELEPSIGTVVAVTDDPRLSRTEIGQLVYNWIGVDGGYLGNFSYAKHDRFWMETCNVHIDTGAFPGTTRECFEETMFETSAKNQAAALRAILEDYFPPIRANR
jgi:hypothetical protein